MELSDVFCKFKLKKGQNVVLRGLRSEDLEDLTELINSLVNEGADIEYDTLTTVEEQNEWVNRALLHQKVKDRVYVIAVVDDKVVGSSSVNIRYHACERHVGDLGILIKTGYHDLGIGTMMMKTLCLKAADLGIKLIQLSVFSSNERGIHVYNKMGFKEIGRISGGIFRNGIYLDRIIMVKQLTE